MILEKLYLENFKQFREPQDLSPPEGAVGVVGANGAGKTTLFEAILWAFFGSRGGGPRFANDSIPWSGGKASDRSLVEVTLNLSGHPYRVSRSLKGTKTEAAVYDGSEERVVSGSADVAAWVQEHLLGMDRVAFEATFFARQKELEFFAGVTGVERQREVARILGIDRVEAAQKLLRAERNDLRGRAKAIEGMLEDADIEGKTAELSEKRGELGPVKEEQEKLRRELESRDKLLADAREEAEKLEGLYRRHNELESRRAAAESARERAAERAAGLREDLRGLDEDEERVARLRPKTRGLGEVAAEIEALEEARRRREKREDAEGELKRYRLAASRALVQASGLLEDLEAGEVPLEGWETLSATEDEAERVRAAEGLLEGAGAAYLAAEEELAGLKEKAARQEELREAGRELEGLREGCEAQWAEVEALDARLAELSPPGGEPFEARLRKLRKKEHRLGRQAAQQNGLADADEREAAKLEAARRMISTSAETAECPTCRRGFEEDEHSEVIEALRSQEEKLRESAEEAREECRRLDEEAGELEEELREIEKSRELFHAVKEKRSGAAAGLERTQERLEGVRKKVEALREELSGAEEVTAEALAQSRRRAEVLRGLRDAYPRICHLCAAYDDARESAEEKEKEVAELSGGRPYDAEKHRELRERRAEIERISGRIETLEARISARPQLQARLQAAVAEEKEAAGKSRALAAEISALGFVEADYLASREKAAGAERSRDEARKELEAADEEARRLEHRIEALEAELARYEEQRKTADGLVSEAAGLSEMDGLFAEFYRELTARVRPRLQDEASDMIRTLTDGRYERVEFDENYGVRLYDGLSDAYEISRFSGGEADVVSLCARVALSKLISARGSDSLGFIVLDEVFGALDADRRRNVLLALDRLKKTFGQIFVISHVGDVQESGLFDELWIVEEDEGGRSSVHRVEQGPVEIAVPNPAASA